MNTNKFEKITFRFAVAFAIVGFIILITSVFFYLNKQQIFIFDNAIDSSKFSDFGTFIGGVVGPFWSLTSILLFYITLRLQRQSIQDTNTKLERDRFESTFYHLLSLHNKNVESIDIIRNMGNYPMLNIKGRGFFKELCLCIEIDYNGARDHLGFKNLEPEDKLIAIYTMAYYEFLSELSHYFRHLYYIITFVDDSKIINLSEKKYYLNLVRAQLSNYEMVLLAYNCISPLGKNFKPLIVKYKLIKNIDFELYNTGTKRIINYELLIEKYSFLKDEYNKQLLRGK